MTATINALFSGKSLPRDISNYILFDLMTVSKNDVRARFKTVIDKLTETVWECDFCNIRIYNEGYCTPHTQFGHFYTTCVDCKSNIPRLWRRKKKYIGSDEMINSYREYFLKPRLK